MGAYWGSKRSKPGVSALGKLLTLNNQHRRLSKAMDILTHSNAFAQQEYRLPTYVPKHFVRILNEYTEFQEFMVGLLCEKTQLLTVALRKT